MTRRELLMRRVAKLEALIKNSVATLEELDLDRVRKDFAEKSGESERRAYVAAAIASFVRDDLKESQKSNWTTLRFIAEARTTYPA